MTKRRISFETVDNYDMGGFRNFIKDLVVDTDKYEVYIISNDDNTAYMNSIGANLGLLPAYIIACSTQQDKIDAIDDNNIDIHFDNLQSFTLLVEETTDAYGILVTPNLNKFYLEPDYQLVFNRTLERILSDEQNP